MEHYKAEIGSFAYAEVGKDAKEADVQIIWGHGWGQNHKSLLPLAESLPTYNHTVLDFQGFGESPTPPQDWQTADFADSIADFIKTLPKAKKRIWVGHSFGGRVAVQLAARHPAIIDGIFIIAGPGLPMKKPLLKKIYLKLKILTYKTLKLLLVHNDKSLEWLQQRFGSADYKNAGAMRKLFLNVIRENLAEQAEQTTCPVGLVYGSADTETPPYIGKGLAELMPNAELTILDGHDHYSVLASGKHQTVHLLQQFIRKILV